MQLKEVIKNIDILKIKDRNIDIKGVVCDSKKVEKDFIFVAIKGNNLDGHKFIKEAKNKGAVCIITEENLSANQSIRNIYAKLCSNFYKNPSSQLKVIGITGTNGKTTTAYLLEAILKKAGHPCGRITTIDYNVGTKALAASNTTPDAGLINELLKDMVKQNLDYCIMEASSHALHQERVNSVKFHSAIFTNLSREHLDYHRTMDEYFLCKKSLFDRLRKEDFAIVNIDDAYGKRLIPAVNANVISYGFSKDADVRAEKEKIAIEGSSFLLIAPNGEIEINTPLIGRHNIYNILAAASAALEEDIDADIIKEAAREFSPPPGRLQLISDSAASAHSKDAPPHSKNAPTPSKKKSGFFVYVDYAHTDDALEKVLKCLAAIKKARIITVFGCGGDRDKGKRPRMARIAAKFSDFVIITSDNPRSENPADIMKQIKKGIPKDFKNYSAVEDRGHAIKKAIGMAKENDIVLLAGKGHETYQIFKDKRVHFDDREVARECIRDVTQGDVAQRDR